MEMRLAIIIRETCQRFAFGLDIIPIALRLAFEQRFTHSGFVAIFVDIGVTTCAETSAHGVAVGQASVFSDDHVHAWKEAEAICSLR
jgi:putative aminopeptidase FrvX